MDFRRATNPQEFVFRPAHRNPAENRMYPNRYERVRNNGTLPEMRNNGAPPEMRNNGTLPVVRNHRALQQRGFIRSAIPDYRLPDYRIPDYAIPDYARPAINQIFPISYERVLHPNFYEMDFRRAANAHGSVFIPVCDIPAGLLMLPSHYVGNPQEQKGSIREAFDVGVEIFKVIGKIASCILSVPWSQF